MRAYLCQFVNSHCAGGAWDIIFGASIAVIQNDPDLLRFATQQGRTLFGDNCETCHGRRGQGVPGYPNLNDDIWIWGGSFDDIKQTINYGIRAEHDDTRFGSMAAYGRDELLEPAQIDDLVQHVLNISGQQSDAASAARGANLFAEDCSACHGEAGKGTRENGAPDRRACDGNHAGRCRRAVRECAASQGCVFRGCTRSGIQQRGG